MSSVDDIQPSTIVVLESIPAGSTAFESPTSCVVRSDARTDGCAWGMARLKLDVVAIFGALYPGSSDFSRACCGVRCEGWSGGWRQGNS
jgi:hypothetical protein